MNIFKNVWGWIVDLYRTDLLLFIVICALGAEVVVWGSIIAFQIYTGVRVFRGW